MEVDPLFEFCRTKRQEEVLTAFNKHGNVSGTANELGIAERTVREHMLNIRRRSNQHHSAGFGISAQMYDGDGNVRVTWVKAKKEQDELLLNLIIEQCEAYKGLVKLIPAPKSFKKNLLNIIPMGDPHLGMRAWGNQTGSEDFNLKIAEKLMTNSVSKLISLAPPAETTIILNLGDFFHSDDGKATTKGTPVDVDGQYGQILTLGISIMITCIELALQKSKYVVVKNLIGNHDEKTSLALAAALDCFFSKNKRVTIDTSNNHFWYYRFGNCLFGATHGDMCKLIDLPQILATDQKVSWGETEFRYWHTGHVHHDLVKDLRGVQVSTYKTMTPRDAWHSAKGYRSMQDMKIITYHKDYGEDSRQIMSLARLRMK
jgi:hypothetical protein